MLHSKEDTEEEMKCSPTKMLTADESNFQPLIAFLKTV